MWWREHRMERNGEVSFEDSVRSGLRKRKIREISRSKERRRY